MAEEMNERIICQVCKKEMMFNEALPAEMIPKIQP